MLPAAALIGLFGIVRSGGRSLLSFQHNDLLTAHVGRDSTTTARWNTTRCSADSIRRTIVYTVLFVPISVAGALAVAMLLHASIRFSRFYRTAVFVPVATSTVATGIIFNWLLEPTYGIANYLLEKVGMGPYGFFQDPDQALYSIVAMTVWGWLGFDVIIYLAALQGIPSDLIEAAELDGAGRWATFRHVTLPLLSPGDAVPDRVVDDQRAAGVRRDLRHHPGRAAACHHGDGLRALQRGVRPVPCRLRRGDRLCAVRDHAGVLVDPAWIGNGRCTTRHEAAAPFSPRHLALLPLSLVMLLPLVWMFITSIETLAETRHFPPHADPRPASTGATIPTPGRGAVRPLLRRTA